jgi:nitrate/nitrite transport system ATP-binding protein
MSILSVCEPRVTGPGKSAVSPIPILSLTGISKSFEAGRERHQVLNDINLRIREGEFLAICGFSGSGKTTLAKIVVGLIKPDEGELLMDGKTLVGPGPERGIVFQNYSLLPWLTVRGNIALSVDNVFANQTRGERRDQVEHFIELVGLSHAARRYPHELSGGMRQRVSLARTLATKPRVLVLDEPLSALDAMTRCSLQNEILRIWEAERQTCLMITNDVDEALFMADRIVPLNPGPAASLGPEYAVDLDRPRDRTALNHACKFKTLRNSITSYLVAIREKSRGTSQANPIALPDLAPRTFRLPSRTVFNSPA